MATAGSVLLTGAAGFVGRHILQLLARSPDRCDLFLLAHRSAIEIPAQLRARATVVERARLGDIPALDTIIHCAAMRRGSRARLFEANVGLTEELVGLTRALDAHFVFVSSLNAGLPRRDDYAESKRRAEDRVQAGDISYTIVRPAYLFAADEEPNLRAFQRLAPLFKLVPLRVTPPFTALVAPLDVEELAELCLEARRDGPFAGCIVEMAGPEERDMWDMIWRFVERQSGRTYRWTMPASTRWLFLAAAREQLATFFQDKTLRARADGSIIQIRGRHRQSF